MTELTPEFIVQLFDAHAAALELFAAQWADSPAVRVLRKINSGNHGGDSTEISHGQWERVNKLAWQIARRKDKGPEAESFSVRRILSRLLCELPGAEAPFWFDGELAVPATNDCIQHFAPVFEKNRSVRRSRLFSGESHVNMLRLSLNYNNSGS